MKVKGTGLISTTQFVLTKFGEDGFEKWLAGMPEETQHALRYPLATSWYPLNEMHIQPGRRACEIFFPDNLKEGARRWGEFNAKREMTGIYKLILKIGSPNMMISLASQTWKMYYSEGAMDCIVNEKGRAVMRTRDVPIRDSLWGHHSAGWMQQGLILAGGKNGTVTVMQKPGNNPGIDDFEFTYLWD